MKWAESILPPWLRSQAGDQLPSRSTRPSRATCRITTTVRLNESYGTSDFEEVQATQNSEGWREEEEEGGGGGAGGPHPYIPGVY